MLRRAGLVMMSCLLLASAGCVRGCTSSRPPIHINPNMDDQPRYNAQAASDFFADGKTMRTPPEGTVARNPLPLELWTDVRFSEGREADGTPVAASPVPASDELLARGQDRFTIYCTPCHDRRGTGRGILFTRGNIPTTSMHLPRVRDSSDGQLFDVISNGVGLMPAYRYPLAPMDRWAVIAYVRRLQAEHEE